MGEFIVSVRDRSGREANRFAVPNTLCNEGIERIYRQIFPPYDTAIDIRLGLAGGDVSGPEGRPQATGGGYPIDLEAVFADAVQDGNEGGGYTSNMRSSFGYFRPVPNWTTAIQAGGGHIVSDWVEFPNEHEWTPQDAEDWDDPSTAPNVEQPPPEWRNRTFPDPIVRYPWQYPRKLESSLGNDTDGWSRSYWYPFDASGGLDWLHDFRKVGGFPITFAFLCDNDDELLLALGYFAAPVHLWPGMTLHVRYEARAFTVDGNGLTIATGAFLKRFVDFAIAHAGANYSTIWVRPVVSTFSGLTRSSAYADVQPHFHSDFVPRALPDWDFVPFADPVPARVESVTSPEWRNEGDEAVTIGALAVYGFPGVDAELMWVTRLETPVSVPPGDTLRIPDKVRFAFSPNL